jgi:uncharacterized protein (TIGR02145 family)
VYQGLKCDSGTAVSGNLNGAFVTFSFDDLYTTSGGNVPKGYEKQWYSTTASTVWQINSEFSSGSDIIVSEEERSAVIMLVLDCTTSLGTDGFNSMKTAVNNFINILSGMTSGSDGRNGVTIGGVTWATSNVGSGTFVANPEDYGGLYSFDEAQTACPAGWRTPTRTEFQNLADSGSVWTSVGGVNGRRFGSGNNTIFLPASGYRGGSTGAAAYQGTGGYYWSSTPGTATNANYLYFSSNSVLPINYYNHALGLSVRCVRM